MRALGNLIVATLLLLSAPVQSHQGSSFTTTVSGIVAPYLPQPSAYVRPHVAQLINTQRLHIKHVAHTYNQSDISGLTDNEFASILVMILYTEHHGWLEDVVPNIRTFTPLFQELQVISNDRLGTNFSVWPANLRPSVIDEIRQENTPLESVFFFKVTTKHHTSNELATDPSSAIELLAANMARGIRQAHRTNMPVTTESILAWHNAGLVDAQLIADNRSVQHYISRAMIYHTMAQSMVRDEVACLQPTGFFVQ
ncbi:MAG: hypothetical protein ACO3F2_10235 [Roseiflexaceae bacterium]